MPPVNSETARRAMLRRFQQTHGGGNKRGRLKKAPMEHPKLNPYGAPYEKPQPVNFAKPWQRA